MALTRDESALLYTRALARARFRVSAANLGGVVLDFNDIARDLRDRATLPAGTTYRDLQAISRRAIRAVEYANELRANPNYTGVQRDVPFGYFIHSNQSKYHYRVVVNTMTNGRLDPGGQLFKFGASQRLTAAEAHARAIRMAIELTPNAQYMPGRTPNTTAAQLGAVVVAVFRFEEA